MRKKYEFFRKKVFVKEGLTLQIDELLQKDKIIQVWPSSLFLIQVLTRLSKTIQGKTILDIGCGTGVSGIVSFQKSLVDVFSGL